MQPIHKEHLNQNDIYFQKSLRQSIKISSQGQPSSKKAPIDLTKHLKCIVYDLHNKHNGIEQAIQALSDDSHALRDHILFQIFKPYAKTMIGEKLIHEPEIWIICFVVFHMLYSTKNKYNEHLLLKLKEEMVKQIESPHLVEQEVQSIISQQHNPVKNIKRKVTFQDDIDENSSNEILEQIHGNQIKQKKQAELKEINDYDSKLIVIDKQTQYNLDEQVPIDQDQEISEQSIEKIIEDQISEIQASIECMSYPVKQRKSFTEKLYQRFGDKAWRSETKEKKLHGIQILNGMESKQLQNNIIAKIEVILENNINENHLHSIAKLSKDNTVNLLENGEIAMIQLKDCNCTSAQYFEDLLYYKMFIMYKYQQEAQIYIPLINYKL